MATRKKSANDIIEQTNRLLSNPNMTADRAQKVIDASVRYRNNIASRKAFARDIKQGRGFEGARSRAYSSNTYMGKNEG